MKKLPRIWFYRPDLYWHGWRTLLPIGMGGDEHGRRTLVIGWNFTGQTVVALWHCHCEDCAQVLRGIEGR